MQSRLSSGLEILVNTALGAALSVVITWLICTLYSIPMTFENNTILTFWMTVASMARGYAVRRWFNRR